MSNHNTLSAAPTTASHADPELIRAEVGSDLQAAMARYMSVSVSEWRRTLAEVVKQYERTQRQPDAERARMKELLEFTRMTVESFSRLVEAGPGYIDHLTPADYSWHDLMAVWSNDGSAGQALWDRIKQTARAELVSGKAGAAAVEGSNERPMQRAEFLAVWVALADGLQPANGTERLLIDSMAQALIQHRHWLHRMVQLDCLDEGRISRAERGQARYEAPRLSEAAAVDRAMQMADRFQRQFLRLMKCYRDGRRLIGSLTVNGGQVNVAEQQINLSAETQSSREKEHAANSR